MQIYLILKMKYRGIILNKFLALYGFRKIIEDIFNNPNIELWRRSMDIKIRRKSLGDIAQAEIEILDANGKVYDGIISCKKSDEYEFISVVKLYPVRLVLPLGDPLYGILRPDEFMSHSIFKETYYLAWVGQQKASPFAIEIRLKDQRGLAIIHTDKGMIPYEVEDIPLDTYDRDYLKQELGLKEVGKKTEGVILGLSAIIELADKDIKIANKSEVNELRKKYPRYILLLLMRNFVEVS
ncbi:MAG: hypothetical protein Q6363_009795 [Candidatus Njordarchaeota archaeon]